MICQSNNDFTMYHNSIAKQYIFLFLVQRLWRCCGGLVLIRVPCLSVLFWNIAFKMRLILHNWLTIQDHPHVCNIQESHKAEFYCRGCNRSISEKEYFGSIGAHFWNSNENECSVHNAAGPFVLSALIYSLFFIRWRREKKCSLCSTRNYVWMRVCWEQGVGMSRMSPKVCNIK